MYCKKCGNFIAEGEKFCGKCGAPLDVDVANSTNGETFQFDGGQTVNSVGSQNAQASVNTVQGSVTSSNVNPNVGEQVNQVSGQTQANLNANIAQQPVNNVPVNNLNQQQDVSGGYNNPLPNNQVYGNVPNGSINQNSPKKNNMIFIIICAVLGVVIVVLLFMLFSGKSNSGKSSDVGGQPTGTTPSQVTNKDTYNFRGVNIVIPDGFEIATQEGFTFLVNKSKGVLILLEVLRGSLSDIDVDSQTSLYQSQGAVGIKYETGTLNGLNDILFTMTLEGISAGDMIVDLGNGYIFEFGMYYYNEVGASAYKSYAETVLSDVKSSSSNFASEKDVNTGTIDISKIDVKSLLE